MFCYRVTKYDPQFRNASGAYTKDEWTGFSDIGEVFEGKLFTLEEYEQVEQKYIEAVLIFMQAMGLNTLVCTYCWKPSKPFFDTTISSHMKTAYKKIRKNSIININTIPTVLSLILHDYLTCKLQQKDLMSVFVGYDYYMYITLAKPCLHAVKKVEKLGLFVEELDKSPYEDIP